MPYGLSIVRPFRFELLLLRMVRPKKDWKNQGYDALNWLTIVFTITLFTIFLALWWTVRVPVYLFLAVVFIIWLDFFFSDYWQPILYLAMGAISSGILFFWAYTGLWSGLLGQTGIILNIFFLLLVLYRYYSEHNAGRAHT